MYPRDWPKCVRCDDFALDGHLTCGRVECDEGRARDERAEALQDRDENKPEWCRPWPNFGF